MLDIDKPLVELVNLRVSSSRSPRRTLTRLSRFAIAGVLFIPTFRTKVHHLALRCDIYCVIFYPGVVKQFFVDYPL